MAPLGLLHWDLRWLSMFQFIAADPNNNQFCFTLNLSVNCNAMPSVRIFIAGAVRLPPCEKSPSGLTSRYQSDINNGLARDVKNMTQSPHSYQATAAQLNWLRF